MITIIRSNKSNTSNIVWRTKLSRVLIYLLLLPVTLGISTSFAQGDGALNWVTTWSASPSSLPAGMLDDASQTDAFQNQTLRLIAHTSIGGDVVRIRVSNTHGNKRLDLGAATIGLQDSGSSVQAATLTTLTFGGEEAITIARGATVVSDPVAFSVPALSNLSVSLFLPNASGTVTTHLAAAQTNYVSSAGNFTDALEWEAAQELPVWNYLTAIDVGRTDEITAIVTLGDSITDGVGSTQSANNRWPNYFARALLSDPDLPDFAVVNAGISGNRVLQENSPRFGENLQVRFERDVLALSGVSHIVLLEGINDIGMAQLFAGEDVSPEEIIAGYRQIISRAHERGIKIIGATLTPFEGAVYYTEEGEDKRQAVNAWIRNSGEFDGIIDFEPSVRDPDNSRRLLPSFTADNLHPNDEGYKAMAEAIDMSLFH